MPNTFCKHSNFLTIFLNFFVGSDTQFFQRQFVVQVLNIEVSSIKGQVEALQFCRQ